MADSAAAATKPSSSVKLVLLGEAAVGKVHYLFSSLLGSSAFPVSTADIVLPRLLVILGTPFREQRFPRKQGTHHRRYVSVCPKTLRRGFSK